MIYSIYKAINLVNGKIYIGFDSNWPNRKIVHKCNSLTKKSNYHFHNAIRKYGWDNFEWEIIYQSKDGEYCLKEMEPYFIQYYNSFNNGYNMTLGGEGNKGPRSEEFKFNMSKIKIGKSHPHKGKPQTDEHKNKKALATSKEYRVINPEGTTQFIINLTKFCKMNNLHVGCMVNTAKGKLNHHKGWKCFYK